MGSYEAGKVYGALNQSAFPNDFAGGVLAETALGPLFLGGSVGDSGHHNWFFQLGRVFWRARSGRCSRVLSIGITT